MKKKHPKMIIFEYYSTQTRVLIIIALLYALVSSVIFPLANSFNKRVDIGIESNFDKWKFILNKDIKKFLKNESYQNILFEHSKKFEYKLVDLNEYYSEFEDLLQTYFMILGHELVYLSQDQSKILLKHHSSKNIINHILFPQNLKKIDTLIGESKSNINRLNEVHIEILNQINIAKDLRESVKNDIASGKTFGKLSYRFIGLSEFKGIIDEINNIIDLTLDNYSNFLDFYNEEVEFQTIYKNISLPFIAFISLLVLYRKKQIINYTDSIKWKHSVIKNFFYLSLLTIPLFILITLSYSIYKLYHTSF